MSYPKEPCLTISCPFCKMDKDYPTTICSYPEDIDKALTDNRIDKNCLWTLEASDNWNETNLSELEEVSSQSDLKAERIERSAVQEQSFQRNCRDPVYHVEDGKDTDNIVFRNGFVEFVDSKFTDEDIFYVNKYDIEKGLDIIKRLEKRNHRARLVIDFWFPRRRLRRNIYLDETCRGYSVKVWVAGRRIMTKLADNSRVYPINNSENQDLNLGLQNKV